MNAGMRVWVRSASALALLSFGKLTGVVVDAGDGTFTVSVIYGGVELSLPDELLEWKRSLMQKCPSGRALTEKVQSLLPPKPYDGRQEWQSFDARAIKEKYSAVPLDGADPPPAQHLMHRSIAYTLSSEAQTCVGAVPENLAAYVHAAIQACNPDLADELLRNIVVTGGTAHADGFVEKLGLRLKRFYPDSPDKVVVVGRPQEEMELTYCPAVFEGALRWASNPNFSKQELTPDEYIKHGRDGAIRRHCSFL